MKKESAIFQAERPADERSDASEPHSGSPERELPTAKEIGGRDGLEPTRYGDWEKNGRCIDF